MSKRDWNEHYASGQLPWDTGIPSEHLTALVNARGLTGKALEVGCGTGTNSLWLAARGFEVLGLDVAPLAIGAAQAKLAEASEVSCRFEVRDFLSEELEDGPFDFAFDRGVFHTFDEHEDRARFAARIAALLVPGGLWLSVIGSTEGPPRDHGPPRRTARDVTSAIEPALEILELRASAFRSDFAPQAWICLSRRRTEPAQPASRHKG